MVIIQHYASFDSDAISASQQLAFWNAIRDYNVIAILHGHTHDGFSNANSLKSRVRKGMGRAARSSAFEDNHFPAYDKSAAKGNSTDPDIGAPQIEIANTLKTSKLRFQA
ncbi:MAG: hypothetical protein ACI89S_000381 [Gammaproteobacteria bacterium]